MRELIEHPLELEWWTLLSPHHRSAAWPVVHNDRFQIGIAPRPTSAQVEAEVVGEGDRHLLSMKVSTYNVLSLVDEETLDQTGRRGGFKSVRMDDQFHQRGLAIVCLQEARTEAGVSFTDHFEIFGAGADTTGKSKQYGCEIWVRRTRSWTKGSAIGFQQTTFAVIHQEPRLLAVRADNTLGTWLFVSAHAPYGKDKDSAEVLSQWWSQVRKVVAKVPGDGIVLLCVDANATLGQHCLSLIGDAGAQSENKASPFFIDCLQETRIACPATFEAIHVGPRGTWWHPSGQWRRIDRIGISEQHAQLAVKSDCWMSFDSG